VYTKETSNVTFTKGRHSAVKCQMFVRTSTPKEGTSYGRSGELIENTWLNDT